MESVLSFFDPPRVFDCTVTPIPGSASAPLQVIEALPMRVTRIIINDGVGDYVGLYTGGVGEEILRAVIASGTVYDIKLVIPKGTRVSLKSMTSAALTTGNLCITFCG